MEDMAEVSLAGGEATAQKLFCFSWQFFSGFVGFLSISCFPGRSNQRGSLDSIISSFHWLLENEAVISMKEKPKS